MNAPGDRALDAGGVPALGSAAELERFATLQHRLPGLFERILPDPRAPRCVLVNPSLSIEPSLLESISGLQHYEERLLCMLLLLRLPRTRVVYVSSIAIDPEIVDYYLYLLPGVPSAHARRRLTMLSCQDPSTRKTLTEKILERPRMLQRIRESIGETSLAHMSCFNVTDKERSLAVQLDIPIYGNDPALEHLGSKSGGRRVFRAAGVDLPPGEEALRDENDMAKAMAALRRRDPALRRATVKLEFGTSGEGNAVFEFNGAPDGPSLDRWVADRLPRELCYEDRSQSWERYRSQFAQMGGVVEAWIEGHGKRSPSVQTRITPLGDIELISTHEQVLGGPSGQIFLGCTFPCDNAYRHEIQDAGLRVTAELAKQSALGRLGVDFVSVKEGDRWRNYAIEINLRKGGTTHPFRVLQLLTGGAYDPQSGRFMTPTGAGRVYRASDNLSRDAYKRLAPDDLMDIAVDHGLHFDAATQEGVFFHLIGALSGYGKLGVVCVASSREKADELFERTVAVLDAESGAEDPES